MTQGRASISAHWREDGETGRSYSLALAPASRMLRGIIIDAARGERRLDSRRSEPASFTPVDGHARVIDWVLHALRASDVDGITFVGGYHIQKVIEQYPELQFRFLSEWTQRGEVEALRAGLTGKACDVLIARATTVSLPGAIERLRSVRGAIAIGLYQARREKTAWTGLMHVPAELADDVHVQAATLAKADPRANLLALIAALEGAGVPVRRVHVDGYAAPLADVEAVAEIAFRGKARTLEQVAPLLKSAVVPASVRFTAEDWRRRSDALLTTIQASLGANVLAVRSSAVCEDALLTSMAGRFRSVLNVDGGDIAAVRSAIEDVIASFSKGGRAAANDDEVIVQRQVTELAACGVMFTRDFCGGGPYVVVHVESAFSGGAGGATPDGVTAGVASGAGVHYVLRGEHERACPAEIAGAIELARELERLMCRDALDIEFARDRQGTLHLLQVRPVAASALAHESRHRAFDEDLVRECEHIHAHVASVMQRHPLLAGETTVMSTMADWNPAEMIGPSPHPLALSLYQRLVGMGAWARSRASLGYRDVQPVPLIHSLGGRPYVDVRASLNSLLPAAMADDVAERLVNDGIERLKADPSAHDKVEFEIAHSCATLDVAMDRARLHAAGVRGAEAERAQRAMAELTDAIVREAADEQRGACGPMGMIDSLATAVQRMRASRGESMQSLASHVQLIASMCVTHGTSPFAVLARRAFVAMTFLRTLRRLGVLTDQACDALLMAIPTVATELERDVRAWKRGERTIDEVIAEYGHLRPSSYDITSPSYARAWQAYFNHVDCDGHSAAGDAATAMEALEGCRRQVAALLRENGFGASFEQVRDFIIESIQLRERGKFLFMIAVHDVLECAAPIGDMIGVSREDVAMMPLSAIEMLATNSPSGAVELEWRRQIEFNRKRWALTSALRLPGLIRSADDVFAFEVERVRPTFLTQSRVSGRIVKADEVKAGEHVEWRGAIALLRAADPGYDWLFSKGIAGLITAWGGAGSHMTVRAAEFGIPAAIGCGELMYESLARARMVELDCRVQAIRVLA